MFGRRKIKVMIDGVTETLTADDVIQIIRERNLARDQRDAALAKRDELRWRARTAEERLARANEKLTQYGHPGV